MLDLPFILGGIMLNREFVAFGLRNAKRKALAGGWCVIDSSRSSARLTFGRAYGLRGDCTLSLRRLYALRGRRYLRGRLALASLPDF